MAKDRIGGKVVYMMTAKKKTKEPEKTFDTYLTTLSPMERGKVSKERDRMNNFNEIVSDIYETFEMPKRVQDAFSDILYTSPAPDDRSIFMAIAKFTQMPSRKSFDIASNHRKGDEMQALLDEAGVGELFKYLKTKDMSALKGTKWAKTVYHGKDKKMPDQSFRLTKREFDFLTYTGHKKMS